MTIIQQTRADKLNENYDILSALLQMESTQSHKFSAWHTEKVISLPDAWENTPGVQKTPLSFNNVQTPTTAEPHFPPCSTEVCQNVTLVLVLVENNANSNSLHT